MEDIKIIFDGTNGTDIDLTSKVEGKLLYHQKCLVNISTDVGSDNIYAARGTDLSKYVYNSSAVITSESVHIGNFAALDTLYFVREQEYAAVASSDDLITDFRLSINSVASNGAFVTFTTTFQHADGTTIEPTIII